MNDWQRVEQLFHTALEMNPTEREEFLTRECAGNAELRAEVDSLIRALEKDHRFLEGNVFAGGLKALSADAAELLVGQTIGGYKIERLLGKGGMGEVYLATDTKLGRTVALKFLARRFAADNRAKRQLMKEAQAAARLDHANICVVHGFEEADGYSFIVMQYIEGESLSRLIEQEQLDSEKALPLAVQMVDAIAHAHEHNILHRDIKPQNIILTTGGVPKVLDFGLAKVVQESQGVGAGESQMSQAGFIMGTVAYMSPEQLRAERLDFRSDIFSLGLVLYAMLSGKHPFLEGNDADTISAILNRNPKPLPYTLNGLSHSMERVVKKCLEKDKERRYQSASELLMDLQSLQTNPPRLPRLPVKPVAAVAVLLALILIGFFAVRYWMGDKKTLVVLPFANEDPASVHAPLIAGLPENLAKQMAHLSQLTIKAPATGLAKQGTQDVSLKVGNEFGANAVLMGNATGKGQDVMLQVHLINVFDGNEIWNRKYDLKHTSALELFKLLAEELADNLNLKLDEGESGKLLAARPKNSAAFESYLKGLHQWKNRKSAEDAETAINLLQQATTEDPTFAPAFAVLADCYFQMPSVAYGKGKMSMEDAVNRARAAARRAMEINERLPEVHTSLGVMSMKYDYNFAEAEAQFKRAIQLDPAYPDARRWYSHLLLLTGRAGEAFVESNKARDLDPFSPSLNLNRCRTRFQARQYEAAAECLNDLLKENPNYLHAKYVLGYVYQEMGRKTESLELFKQVYDNDKLLGVSPLAFANGKLGRVAEAQKLIAELEERAKNEYVPPLEFAIAHVGLGNRDKAFEYLEKAYEERFANLIYLAVEPLFGSLRSDPRFDHLAQRLKLNP